MTDSIFQPGLPSTTTLMTRWGTGGPKTANKVPTVLQYDNNGIHGAFSWGYKAQAANKRGVKIHEWFKLGLCNNFEGRRAQESELLAKYPSTTALAPVGGADCEKLVVNFLTAVRQCVDDSLLGVDETVYNTPREYIITVPALWDHAEQDKTRTCAQRAGIGAASKVQVISEPEAAGIYALDSMQRIGLQVGHTFVICDAGGGTVDLASYTIKAMSPSIQLAEADIGSGGLCGSIFLNRIFENYIGRKMRGYPGVWNKSFLEEALEKFEQTIKPDFTGEEENSEDYGIRIHGLKASPRHGVSENYLNFTVKELREKVFDEVLTKVEGLVRDQIANTQRRARVRAVLLAGGFGQNPYLQKKLRKIDLVMRDKIKIIQIENRHVPHQNDTAIVRGALIAGLTGQGRAGDNYHDDGGFNTITGGGGTRVVSRIAGRHYGTCAVYRDDGDKVEQMYWFVKAVRLRFYSLAQRALRRYIAQSTTNQQKGESIANGRPTSFDFEKVSRVDSVRRGSILWTVHIYASEEETPAEYKDSSVREIASFELELQKSDMSMVEINGVEFYQAIFKVEMTLHSASLSFCGVYGHSPNERRFAPKKVRFV
ncbi:hypothetical protein QQS21_010246 [Conoideocrella luteorostrata]|uniref:Actin-like ATPase domain-containing protein n=1 Tax=Conoideocrella luteorostrata TaxID=1105319 RepID=A0AAJ0FPJ6_9HYPO|nr:hypothetical protein QQS21_010246 [Conoideocrella luteorostrata]